MALDPVSLAPTKTVRLHGKVNFSESITNGGQTLTHAAMDVSNDSNVLHHNQLTCSVNVTISAHTNASSNTITSTNTAASTISTNRSKHHHLNQCKPCQPTQPSQPTRTSQFTQSPQPIQTHQSLEPPK